MSNRCTNITLMYAGGMADLISNCVYFIDKEQAVTRLTNTLQLKHLGNLEGLNVIVSSSTLELTVEEFNNTNNNKKYVSIQKVFGADHSDKPITTKEKEIREMVTSKLYARAKTYFKYEDSYFTPELMSKTERLMDQVGAENFYRSFAELTNNNKAKSYSNILAYVEAMPTLSEKANSLANQYNKQNNKTAILAELNVTAHQPLGYKIQIDYALNDAIADHAYARWLERIDGVVDRDLVEKAILSAMSAGRSNNIKSYKEDFEEKCSRLGIDQNRGKNIRQKISELLSNSELKFSARSANTESSTVDRFNASLTVGNQLLEFTLFPYQIKKRENQEPVLMVKVLSVLDRNHNATLEDTFTVGSVTASGSTINFTKTDARSWNRAAEKSLADLLK